MSISPALSTITQLEPDTRRLGLLVISSAAASRLRFDDVLAREKAHADLRIVSVRSLVALAELVSVGTLKHEDVVKLLASASNLDFAVELLARIRGDGSRETAIGEPEVRRLEAVHGPLAGLGPPPRPPKDDDLSGSRRYWLATIVYDGTAPPRQAIELLIAKRQMLPVA